MVFVFQMFLGGKKWEHWPEMVQLDHNQGVLS